MTPATEVSLTLYDTEQILLSLTEVDAEALSPEQRAEFEGILIEAVRTSVEKRERVAWRLFDLGQRAEVKRAAAAAHRKKADELDRSADAFDRQASGLKDYVLRVMAELPKPKRGVRTLEGTSATFKAKAVVDAVEIEREDLIPLQYQVTTVKMPADQWKRLLAHARHGKFEEMIPDPTWAISKTLVKEALRKTVPCTLCFPSDDPKFAVEDLNDCPDCHGLKTVPAHVPGARLLTDRLRLVVE